MKKYLNPNNEPAAYSGAVVAILNALVLLNVIHLTLDQIAGVNVALISVLTLGVRAAVTPTQNIPPTNNPPEGEDADPPIDGDY